MTWYDLRLWEPVEQILEKCILLSTVKVALVATLKGQVNVNCPAAGLFGQSTKPPRGSGSSIHNIEDFQPPHGFPRIFSVYQSPYDINPSRSTPQSSDMQDHARSNDDHRNFLLPENEYQVPTTTFPSGSYSIKGKERQSQDFGQSPHSGIQSLKGKERQYQDFEESLDGDKSKEKQTPLPDYEEIETDEDKILSPEVPTSSPRTNVYLKCSQGEVKLSKARSDERTSSTRRTGCKYEVSGRISTRKNLWTLCPRWMQNIHNHESAPAISDLSTHRRFDHKEHEMIYNHSAVGASPKQILSTLKNT
ncbi:hypothetical protein PPACK8108_LOCUS21865 [Phakopsora pachyrhizi]|uniref:FAR1 domain-containing protein n=1 Tax=Phakopsora pachyrhizi TaxID=170000 RepID=A0AAV0BJJ8_PHAPC|nr:hypothetical protein PPACK8108_LOCUS21865 [Phakopsora pachyrhizi]